MVSDPESDACPVHTPAGMPGLTHRRPPGRAMAWFTASFWFVQVVNTAAKSAPALPTPTAVTCQPPAVSAGSISLPSQITRAPPTTWHPRPGVVASVRSRDCRGQDSWAGPPGFAPEEGSAGTGPGAPRCPGG